jgi:two-component system chemotaxis response regulator CheB
MRLFPHSDFDVVAIAASAGGVPAIASVLAALPAAFPVPLIVAQHVSANSVLLQLLARYTRAPLAWAARGSRARPGTIYFVPPHLSVTVDHELRCDVGSVPERYVFGAPDRLFASIAEACGPRAVAVVLTGAGSAGARGALAVRRAGGVVIAQDGRTSAVSNMPAATIAAGAAALVLPLESIPRALVALTMVPGSRDVFVGAPERRRRIA